MTNNGDSLNVNNCEEVAEAACESAEGIVADRLGRFAMPEQIGSNHIELLCEHGHNGIPGLGTPGEPVDQQDCLRVVRLMRRAHPAVPDGVAVDRHVVERHVVERRSLHLSSIADVRSKGCGLSTLTQTQQPSRMVDQFHIMGRAL